MPKGTKKTLQNLANFRKNLVGPRLQATVTKALIVGGMYADLITPIDTGNLLRSRYREVKQQRNGWLGYYGYTASYAASVHAASGKLKGLPRALFNSGTGVGNFWDPNAEPGFLVKGFERDGFEAIRKVFEDELKV